MYRNNELRSSPALRWVKVLLFLLCFLIIQNGAGTLTAQEENDLSDPFKKPDIEKVEHEDRKAFLERFEDIKWTGQGLYDPTVMDRIPTIELRARFQTAFGEPTQKLEDLIGQKDFRPAEYIQFEYWFTVDDSIPMMVLDLDGPFEKGLVYGGASRYIDLMPQVKRTLAQMVMEVDSLAPFRDYYYHLDKEQWFEVKYSDGEFKKEEIEQPENLQLHPQSQFKGYRSPD